MEPEKVDAARVERMRYASLGAALLASGATGVTYTFGVYSGGLKKKFDLSQSQVDTIGQFTFLGGVFTFITGMANDKFGAQVTSFFGGLCLTGVEVLYWAVARGHIHADNPEVALAALAPFIQIFAGFLVAGVFATLVRNFPRNRGAVVGLGKGWVGLFGGASTQVFGGLFFVPDKHDPKSVDYVLFCAALIFCLTVLPSPALRVVPKDTDEEARRSAWLLRRRMQLGFSVVVASAVMVALAAILKSHLGDGGHLAIALVILVLWVVMPVFVNVPPRMACPKEGDLTDSCCDSDEEEEGQPSPGRASAVTTSSVSIQKSEADHLAGDDADIGPEMTITEMVKTPDCWILYLVCSVSIGGGTMLTTNLGQITESLALASSSSAISMFSVGQALSRMATGMLSDAVMLKWGITRPLFLAVSPLLMCAAHLTLLAATTDAELYIGVLLAGAGFGATWPLMVVLVSELFGRKNLGGNYMLYDGWTAALGSLALAKFVPQTIYDEHASSDSGSSGSSSGGETCYGRVCFGWSFAIIAALSCGAVLLSLLLHCRNRAMYRRLIDHWKSQREGFEKCPAQDEEEEGDTGKPA
eukprot:TRINITY_DN1362_c4_g1_i1.p1 TRINITY_DN1362_c4_g1~~TRINITY_DN1362_c4_g1_i1.p1  ORF type:complete len:585 (+),score=192.53 TRINITY_DN1362_c4_g1_i1:67-1821(+)